MVRLDEPTAEAVRDAFSALPHRGYLECVCRWERRLAVLAALEDAGAFAIRFAASDGFASVRIEALKGKSGPCYDTGRSASYGGGAAAVLDDDRHLIVGAIRVCEKTGGLYALWPYRGLLAVTEAEPGLLARLESDPVPFDCNTFDADCQRLAAVVAAARESGVARVAVVYPGPFRAVVLGDGSVVRRGVAALIPEAEAGENGLLRLPQWLAKEACGCETFSSACRARGAAFILEPLSKGVARVAADTVERAELSDAALAALRAAPLELKRRLLRLVETREPYLVLTGSDPEVSCGCCPSTQVGAANRLVEAGALRSYAPPAPPDSCAATFDAFPGEIHAGRNAPPEFRVQEALRVQAEVALRDVL